MKVIDDASLIIEHLSERIARKRNAGSCLKIFMHRNLNQIIYRENLLILFYGKCKNMETLTFDFL